ncbi:putative E3 ubiquitin-protein ligase SINAT1 isoform X2 [Harmonia axyridis]|uniref:putative E3 ubiquitin-protein ligase SINAT1 isoform X2 n=1 Tax=Harmonia axyridis TaxID=115357 RepID=UPI001E275A51|nr:putative E3 ubiquitin-protein ligase SINAT1 isoform X2 [Harmonia axyridis]
MSENLDKCLSCDNYFLPPIYQCPRGHTLCSHCTQDAQYMISTSEYNLRQAKLKSVTKVKLFCGSCMNFYFINEELRNEDIERSVEAVKYPCTFKKDGCQFEDIYTKIKTHNETCCFMVGVYGRGHGPLCCHTEKSISGSRIKPPYQRERAP